MYICMYVHICMYLHTNKIHAYVYPTIPENRINLKQKISLKWIEILKLKFVTLSARIYSVRSYALIIN